MNHQGEAYEARLGPSIPAVKKWCGSRELHPDMRFGRPPCLLLNITAALKLESRRGNAPRNARFADGAVHLPGRGTRKEDDTHFTNYHGFDSALSADDPCDPCNPRRDLWCQTGGPPRRINHRLSLADESIAEQHARSSTGKIAAGSQP